jgi:transcriptional regulator with XRE-family HTH domain
MKLGEKLRHLRQLEGVRRGMPRPLSQAELSRLVSEEMEGRISQAYLSQIERGHRPHLTSQSRTLLARFFEVHPGYLVDDPDHFESSRASDPQLEGRVDHWLNEGAERFRDDPELSRALLTLSHRDDSRNCLIALGQLLEKPRKAADVLGLTAPRLSIRKRSKKRRS